MQNKESGKDSEIKSKRKRKRKDPRIESEYFEEMEFTDPTTGKKYTQKVKITRYKAAGAPKVEGNKGLPDEDIELEDGFEYVWGDEED